MTGRLRQLVTGRFARDTAATQAGLVISALCAFATSIILWRGLGQAGYGQYALVFALVLAHDPFCLRRRRRLTVKTAPPSIPVALNIPGLTARIYAIVRNVVIPATTSVLTFVPFSVSLKNLSIIKIPPMKF